MSLRGHYWTIAPRVRHGWRPLLPPDWRPWATSLEDPVTGRVSVTGRLREVPESEELAILVHGLGGSTESHYMIRGAQAAEAAGVSCLRLNLRGCDRESHDFFHAGLTADLHAALASEELARYRRIYVIGYSLGGHVVLRLATEGADPRLAGVGALCAPLDLRLSQQAIDAPLRWPYRRYLLSSLVTVFAAVAARRPQPLTAEEVARIPTIFEWDDRVVAPRHGFTGALDYYARASVAPRLGELRVPALLLNSESDPMVPPRPVRAVLGSGSPLLEVRWLAGGGHVAFPRGLDAGLGTSGEVDSQVLGWLRAR
ncbi:MAG TPA: alpha/beta fold hydrolase [Thermoanaerobaculia bacterium]|nr:alpha/beta fold hydrolase [Thermoanaerobaculia bacterium]